MLQTTRFTSLGGPSSSLWKPTKQEGPIGFAGGEVHLSDSGRHHRAEVRGCARTERTVGVLYLDARKR